MAEKIGSGRRFRGLEAKLAAKGFRDPAAGAAAIGRRKYGNARFQELAKAGKERAKQRGTTRRIKV